MPVQRKRELRLCGGGVHRFELTSPGQCAGHRHRRRKRVGEPAPSPWPILTTASTRERCATHLDLGPEAEDGHAGCANNLGYRIHRSQVRSASRRADCGSLHSARKIPSRRRFRVAGVAHERVTTPRSGTRRRRKRVGLRYDSPPTRTRTTGRCPGRVGDSSVRAVLLLMLLCQPSESEGFSDLRWETVDQFHCSSREATHPVSRM